MPRYKKRKGSNFIISLIIIAAVIFSLWQVSENGNFNLSNSTGKESNLAELGEDILVAEFLDVGQGDSSFFTLPDGKTLLVDAANNGDGEKIADYLKSKGVNKIDYLVATHPHADHIGGMAEIIENMEIGKIYAPKLAEKSIPTTKTYENFLLAVQNKGLKITAAKGGTTLFLGENYKAECLAPLSESYDNLNNYSIVFKLTYKNHSFLLTGDAETEVENQILNDNYNIKCDVLKVGHHGSSTSSSAEFLKAVSPKIAIISCGKDNSYGHPHDKTLKALSSLSGLKELYRTDKDKTITVTSDGEDGLISTKNNASVA